MDKLLRELERCGDNPLEYLLGQLTMDQLSKIPLMVREHKSKRALKLFDQVRENPQDLVLSMLDEGGWGREGIRLEVDDTMVLDDKIIVSIKPPEFGVTGRLYWGVNEEMVGRVTAYIESHVVMVTRESLLKIDEGGQF